VLYISTRLLLAISGILLLSARFRLHTFFVLLVISIATGLAAGLDGYKIIELLKTGFGKTLEKVGLLVILGTTLGILLEKSGATLSLAAALLR